MDKAGVYACLKGLGIWHEITEHKAVYNMEETFQLGLPYPEAEAKNLFIRDDKKENYYLITVRGNKRVDLKAFRKENSTRPLKFASERDLMSIMGLTPGAVTPFGLLNDEEKRVSFFIDEDFLKGKGIIGVHPNDNTATVWLMARDLMDIIRNHGNKVEILLRGGVRI